MAVDLGSNKMREVIATALKRYDEAVSADQDERDLAIDDYSFTYNEDGQWDDLAKLRRRNKPRYTINKVAPAVNEVVGNYRQNRVDLKARPESDIAKDEAKTYEGLLRAIQSTSEAKLAKDIAFKMIAATGFGAIRVLNKFSHNNPFEQDVCWEPIPEALTTVFFDPFAKDPTGKDGTYVFETTTISREKFQEQYPKADLAAWPDSRLATLQVSWGLSNLTDDIRIADYYVKEPVKSELVLLSNGDIITKKAFDETVDELLDQGIEFVDERRTTTFKVMHYKMSGNEVLEQPAELPTEWLPIIRVLGYNEWHDGVLHYRGIVRASKDPQRVFNYATSANIEAVALTPKAKWSATKKMIQGHESSWAKINTSDSPVVTYTPDTTAPGGKPTLMDGGQPQMGLIQQVQQAELDIQSVMGRRSPAQGESANDRSGRAILALQKQDDSVTFELLDNLAKSVVQCGVVTIDMIPAIYDQERQVLILGDDDQESIVTINDKIKDEETGEEFTINDTGKKYRIKATVGPAFETKRTEMVNVLSTLSQDPALQPIVADLMVQSMDFPFADELTSRIRKLGLQNGVLEPNEEELAEIQAQQQTPEAQQSAAMAQQIKELQLATAGEQFKQLQLTNANMQANIADIQANTAKKIQDADSSNANAENKRASTYETIAGSFVKQLELGLPISQDQMQMLENAIQMLNADLQQGLQQRMAAALQQAQQLGQ